MMVLLDTNVFISFLLARGSRTDVADVVRVGLMDTEIELIVPQEVIDVIERVVGEKEYLQAGISTQALAEL